MTQLYNRHRTPLLPLAIKLPRHFWTYSFRTFSFLVLEIQINSVTPSMAYFCEGSNAIFSPGRHRTCWPFGPTIFWSREQNPLTWRKCIVFLWSFVQCSLHYWSYQHVILDLMTWMETPFSIIINSTFLRFSRAILLVKQQKLDEIRLKWRWFMCRIEESVRITLLKRILCTWTHIRKSLIAGGVLAVIFNPYAKWVPGFSISIPSDLVQNIWLAKGKLDPPKVTFLSLHAVSRAIGLQLPPLIVIGFLSTSENCRTYEVAI